MNSSETGSARAASGEQYEIAHGDLRAVIVEVGGGIRTLRRADVELLDGYAAHEICPSGAGQVLAPWPNRMRDGSYELDGVRYQLPLSEPKTGTAIHGLVRWDAWRAVAYEKSSVAMRYVLHPRPGYPFRLELTTTWSLGAAGLRVQHEALNLGEAACPFGLGIHPYLMLPARKVDDVWLTLPASRYLPTDARQLPLAGVEVARSDFDYRKPRRIGNAVLDTAFTECTRDGDGLARVRLADERGQGIALWMDAAFPFVQLFTGDTVKPERRRRALAVEPMTCAADAFNNGQGLVSLAPGQRWHGVWGISPT
jgi:aldose 1-epimerase